MNVSASAVFSSQSVELPVKQRCPIDGHTNFYYTQAGLSLKCRHCKQVHVVTWTELFQQYSNVQQEKSA